MRQINKGIGGVLFIIDDEFIMTGILTDGDIRRALLAGAKMTDSLIHLSNKSFVFADIGMNRSEQAALLSNKVRHVPILDHGKPVDFISWVIYMIACF